MHPTKTLELATSVAASASSSLKSSYVKHGRGSVAVAGDASVQNSVASASSVEATGEEVNKAEKDGVAGKGLSRNPRDGSSGEMDRHDGELDWIVHPEGSREFPHGHKGTTSREGPASSSETAHLSLAVAGDAKKGFDKTRREAELQKADLEWQKQIMADAMVETSTSRQSSVPPVEGDTFQDKFAQLWKRVL